MTPERSSVGVPTKAKRTRASQKSGAIKPRPQRKPTKKAAEERRTTAAHAEEISLPSYDSSLVGRIVGGVEILDVSLIGAHFERADDGALQGPTQAPKPNEIGISPRWELSTDKTSLGCTVTFSTVFDEEGAPYSVVAGFRLVYSLEEGLDPRPEELEQFVYWNVVFNAWPYWREYLSSTINRAHLPVFALPVMKMPR
jgi:hypothetical protein